MTESFAPEYQADLLSACYANPHTFSRIRSFVEPSSFTIPQLRWLYELGAHTLDSSGALPSNGLVAQEAGSVFKDPEEFAIIIEMHDDITKTKRENLEAVVNLAAEFSELSRFEALQSKVSKLRAAGKTREAMALMNSQSWRVSMPAEFSDNALRGYDDFELFNKQAKERRDSPHSGKLPTSIIGLDVALQGGLALCETATIVGFTGRGKSSVLYNFTDSFIMHGFGVIMVISEMRPDQVLARLLARRTRITHNIIFSYSFTPEQEREYLRRVEKHASTLTRKLYIGQVGTDGMTRESIARTIEAGSKHVDNLSSVMIDTIDHCKMPAEYKGDFREGRKANANWVHGLGNELKAALIVTSQANRDGFEWTDLNNMADTMEVARVSEVVIAVNEDQNGTRPNPEDHIEQLMAPPQPMGSMVLSVVKARGGAKVDVPISTDLATALMTDRAMDNFEIKIG